MNENCTCPKTDFQTENVIELKPHPFLTELHNASFFNQIHKRTTHSREAFVALLCIGGLTSLVIVSVFLSKMWREKSTFSVQQKQHIQYTQHGPKDEILVRDMIRQRAQAFKSYFKDKKPENAKQSDDIDHSSHGTYLNMESFPSQNISSVNNEFLDSSSDDENETVFAWNKKTGEWNGFDSSNSDFENDENTFSFQDWTSKLSDILNLKMKKTKKSAKDENMDENRNSDNDEFDSDTPLISM